MMVLNPYKQDFLATLFKKYNGHNQWAAQKSTVVGSTTTWIDYKGIHNVLNPLAANQPTTTSPDVTFNKKNSATFLTNDKLQKDTPNYGVGQTTGGIWLVLETYINFTATSTLFSVGDNASNSNLFQIYINTLGQLNLGMLSSPSSVIKTVTTPLSISTKYIVYIYQSGTEIVFYINGILAVSTGTATIQWLDYVNTLGVLDNIVIGARDTITDVYSNGKIVLVGNYPLLDAAGRTDMFNELNEYYNVY